MSTTINPTKPAEVQESSKPKKERARKPFYEVAEGVKLTETPDDFNPDTHRMAKKVFKDGADYIEHQAWVHEYRAKELHKKAEEWRLNPPAKRSAAKKAKMVERLSKLEAKLAELGVNVDDLFGDED